MNCCLKIWIRTEIQWHMKYALKHLKSPKKKQFFPKYRIQNLLGLSASLLAGGVEIYSLVLIIQGNVKVGQPTNILSLTQQIVHNWCLTYEHVSTFKHYFNYSISAVPIIKMTKEVWDFKSFYIYEFGNLSPLNWTY